LDDLKNVGESSCNPGVGTDQRVQSLMFMMMMMMMMMIFLPGTSCHSANSLPITIKTTNLLCFTNV
jgi:hypothetical protein